MYIWWDITAMRWPCPEGFHVPSSTERQELLDIMTTAYGGLSPIIMQYALKMPLAGARISASWDIRNVGKYGMYWTSSTYENNQPLALTAMSQSSTVSLWATFAANAYLIRAFKDTPVIPDSSWSGDGTVYWSSSLGLISISSDWTNWITMQDKNLWATTAFNYWDTLTEDNCGYFYQWWNNYWFPNNWDVFTSSTLVDASWYGPWNYYSAGVFITNSTGSRDRSSVANNNLWWWVSWPTKEIKRVTIRPNGTEKQIRPAWWTPWANTTLYLPLNWDITDPYNQVTYNWVWTSSFDTWSTGVQAANLTWSNAINLWASTDFEQWTGEMTVLF